MFVAIAGYTPSLWKADIDSAFRRVPVAPEERGLCGVVFVAAGKVSRHDHSVFGMLVCL